MNRPSLTLHEARAYAALATLAGLTASAATGAAAHLAAGPGAGVTAGALTALATVGGAVGALRLLVTSRD